MSTLTDAVQARIATARLVELTQKDSRSGTTVNTTVLAAAGTDAEATFATLTGLSFDSTDPRHIALGVQGVLSYLIEYRGQDNSWKIRRDWERACEQYRLVNANRRIAPTTNRSAGPSSDVDSASQPRRPEFDRTRFRDLDILPPPSDRGA